MKLRHRIAAILFTALITATGLAIASTPASAHDGTIIVEN
jgi:hypothetical protein